MSYFLWVPTLKGTLTPVVCHADIRSVITGEEIKHFWKKQLTPDEAGLPLGELEKKYPAPAYQVNYD